MSTSGTSPSQSMHGSEIHMSPQHSLSNTMNSTNDLHERSYIQCE